MLIGGYEDEPACTGRLTARRWISVTSCSTKILSRLAWNFEKAIELLPCPRRHRHQANHQRADDFHPRPRSADRAAPGAAPTISCASGTMAGFNQGGGIGRVHGRVDHPG